MIFERENPAKKRTPKKKSPLELAVQMLSARALSRNELKKKLHDKEIPWQDCEKALLECERLGFVNDAETAKNSVRSMRNRGNGARKIKQKLRQHGFKKEDVEHAFDADAEESGRSETDVAAAMLRKKLPQLEREPDRGKRRMKALRALAAKGFPPDAAFAALDSVLGNDFDLNFEQETEIEENNL